MEDRIHDLVELAYGLIDGGRFNRPEDAVRHVTFSDDFGSEVEKKELRGKVEKALKTKLEAEKPTTSTTTVAGATGVPFATRGRLRPLGGPPKPRRNNPNNAWMPDPIEGD